MQLSPEQKNKLIRMYPELGDYFHQQEMGETLKTLASRNKIMPDIVNRIKAIRGDKGEKGDKGDKGDRGLTGLQGIPGRDGKDGKDGKNGRNGLDGINGSNGRDGKDGADGKDASFDPKVIDEKIADGMKAVDGRIKLIDQRWHGAGLSRVTTDSTLTGSGTAVSPLSVVAGSGTGTVTSVSIVTANGLQGTVASASTTPAITLNTDASHYLPTTTDQTNWNAKGTGTVTAVSVATANGVSGSSSGGATPALTITLGAITPSSVNGNTITPSTGTVTLASAKALTVDNSLELAGTDGTIIHFPTTTASAARIDAAQTFTGAQTFTQVLTTNNAITASGNAATVPVTSRINTVTNNSAATLTVTMATASAIDRQLSEVLVLDATGVAQTITWVLTENSTVSAPTTSNGSTTLPLATLFQYNNATSKWRTIASA